MTLPRADGDLRFVPASTILMLRTPPHFVLKRGPPNVFPNGKSNLCSELATGLNTFLQLTNGCAWNAVSAFANCGRAVAHLRGLHGWSGRAVRWSSCAISAYAASMNHG
jgi:hypothetical protein